MAGAVASGPRHARRCAGRLRRCPAARAASFFGLWRCTRWTSVWRAPRYASSTGVHGGRHPPDLSGLASCPALDAACGEHVRAYFCLAACNERHILVHLGCFGRVQSFGMAAILAWTVCPMGWTVNVATHLAFGVQRLCRLQLAAVLASIRCPPHSARYSDSGCLEQACTPLAWGPLGVRLGALAGRWT